MSGQFDLGEVAFSDGFKQPVVSDMRLLWFLRAAGPYTGPARAAADLLASITVRCVLWKRSVTINECYLGITQVKKKKIIISYAEE